VLKNFVTAQATKRFFVASALVCRGEDEDEGLPIFCAISFDPNPPLTLMKGEATRAAFSAYYLCERHGRINEYCGRNPFENLFARQTRFDLIN